MFEVGFSELLLIMGLALLVLGPEKLPKVVGEIGRWMGRARAMARQFREQLEDEAAESSRRRAAATSANTTPAAEPAAAEPAPAEPAPAETAPVDASVTPSVAEPAPKAGPDNTP
ncbi:MAG: Sec-independent protein translocase protein TatB [Gammaproteobacteria bacterium]|jgi:sec-independent protein translocase protein TatB|nr:twin-arginine translocase subunit TatB [Betaproteobacteria bacterium]